MTPERWARMKEIFGAALQMPEVQRGAYLDSTCSGDAELRGEIERLLAEQCNSELHSPVSGVLRPAPTPAKGDMLGRYRIEEKLGEGGMGVVYRAYDAELRRPVAIKMLSPASDVAGRRRLLVEARAASALNHPNIVTVHEIGSATGVDFIAMEFVEGKSLKNVIPAKGLPLGKALDYAVQISSALAKAHGAGLIHRDLKPSNVMVTPDGLVKLLDFGLARRVGGVESETASLTVEGEIVGTPAYMSPEQAEGKSLDARSDVFSFGAVLYQMLTGRQAFTGETRATVLASVLREAPPPLGMNIPRDVEKVVIRCLQKDPAHRFQHMDDVRVALQELKEESASGARTTSPSRQWSAKEALSVAILVSVVALMIVLNIGNWRGRALGRAGASRIESLAVLPVKNFSGDPGQEFFADGMTDALIAGLGQIKAVKVISRTSAMHYKGTSETLPQIAGELGVDGIVEASVMRSGGRVRITAQLLEARKDRHLWASNYERAMTDVLALQSEVVQAIADAIRVEITPQESERLKTSRRIDPAVYDDTLRADAILEYAFREEQIRQAIELYRRVIDRDPTYAPEWAGLSLALWRLAETRFEFVAPEEVRSEAIAAADRALALDANLGEAHWVRALLAWDAEWDLAKALQQGERALEAQPGDASAHVLYGQMLTWLQRFDEARRHIDQFRELACHYVRTCRSLAS